MAVAAAPGETPPKNKAHKIFRTVHKSIGFQRGYAFFWCE